MARARPGMRGALHLVEHFSGTWQYYQKILTLGPIAYWPQWETAGTTIHELVDPPNQDGVWARDASIMGPVAGIGDGNTAVTYDGVTDYGNVLTPALVAAFTGPEGSLMVWARAANPNVWAAPPLHFLAVFAKVAGLTDFIWFYKVNGIADSIRARYRAGGVDVVVNIPTGGTLDWFQVIMTWSTSADALLGYFNGAPAAGPTAGLGVWGGPIARAILGAQNGVPTDVWDGPVGPVILWDRAITPVEVASTYPGQP